MVYFEGLDRVISPFVIHLQIKVKINKGGHRERQGMTMTTNIRKQELESENELINCYSILSELVLTGVQYCRYFQYAHFTPIVGVGKRGAY